jgi:cytochrome P450
VAALEGRAHREIHQENDVTNGPAVTVPTLDVDIFDEDVIVDPYPVYRELRDAGPVVRMKDHDLWVISRYDDVRAVLGDARTFSSATGVGVDESMNAFQAGTVLASDDPEHANLRRVLTDKLSPRALAQLRTTIAQRADALVEQAVTRGELDGVADLTAKLPVDVVADLIGLPKEGREILLSGADAMFAGMGPMDERLQRVMPSIGAYVDYMRSVTSRDVLSPDGWGAAILDAVDAGEISSESAMPLMQAYLIAGMDTTVHALAGYIRLLAEDQDLWHALKAEPDLVGSGFEEVLRMESPAQNFTRLTTRATEVDGALIPAGARVVVSFASANRDERHYSAPDRFDLRRNPVDHLAFGYATHGCAGQGLARIEARALIEALLRRVDSIRLTADPVRHSNPIIRGLEALPIAVVPAKEA